MKIRTGLGYDVHQLADGHDFFLGGIKIPHTKGAVGHSDADVLLHTICDALLGAANKRDIGFHFPDTSDDFKGIDSKILLKRVGEIIAEEGYEIGNIDATVCLQNPKIGPYIDQMRETIAEVLGIDAYDVSVKATTTERLGFVGTEDGVSALAIVLISKL